MPRTLGHFFRAQSLPSRGAWIEMQRAGLAGGVNGSLPSRGAWIEMNVVLAFLHFAFVAPLTGSVD